MADLLFGLPPGGTDLLFGETAGAIIPDVSVEITGAFAPLTFAAQIAAVETVTITGSFAPLTVAVEAQYRSNAARPLVNETGTNWQVARPTSDGVAAQHMSSMPSPVGWEAPWQGARGAHEGVAHTTPNALRKTRVAQVAPHQDAQRLHDQTVGAYQVANASVRKVLRDAFERAQGMRDDTLFRHQDGDRAKRGALETSFQKAQRLAALRQGDTSRSGVPFVFGRTGRYQEGVPPPPGLTIYVPPVVPGPEPCYLPNTNLLFKGLFDGTSNLLFVCDNLVPPVDPPEGQVVIPVKKVYIVQNNVTLRRVSDNAAVFCESLRLSLDFESWSWGFSATLPAVVEALVEPTNDGPVELDASINGTVFRVVVETLARERTFGRVSLRVGGRSKAAYLDSPYAAQQVFTNAIGRTAEQLMGDVLSLNGVPLPWDVDFQLEDWLVPAGVWSHQGSYITALNAIANAAGGYIRPHPSLQSFSVLHRYPTKPWEWTPAIADFVLPSAVVTREGVEWREKPLYNRAFVSGQSGGILGQITRLGTAGDLLAPLVVDPLITEAVAARQRGLAILGDTGRQQFVSLRLPVLPASGIIQPGAMVEYVDGGVSRVGIVRATEIEASFPDVFQTLGVETHGFA